MLNLEEEGRTRREVQVAHKLSAKARIRLGVLEEARRKWDRVHALVEKVVSASHSEQSRRETGRGSPVQHLVSQLSRASHDVSRLFADKGLEGLAQEAAQIADLIRRGGPIERHFARMRELVGTVSTAMELAERKAKKGR